MAVSLVQKTMFEWWHTEIVEQPHRLQLRLLEEAVPSLKDQAGIVAQYVQENSIRFFLDQFGVTRDLPCLRDLCKMGEYEFSLRWGRYCDPSGLPARIFPPATNGFFDLSAHDCLSSRLECPTCPLESPDRSSCLSGPKDHDVAVRVIEDSRDSLTLGCATESSSGCLQITFTIKDGQLSFKAFDNTSKDAVVVIVEDGAPLPPSKPAEVNVRRRVDTTTLSEYFRAKPELREKPKWLSPVGAAGPAAAAVGKK